ncbi:MAG TPA: iron-containing alcohol dehydrogenase [bacterium]|nr:iron-containing alcohol dehydrogenase [bacterium]HQI49636.1 iron-containing alcohol dehydrogenase [bacterium]HQJ65670.1 iron-containing alcohol dehydrogenase [bacterium]
MYNFTYRNPVRVIFGKGSIARLQEHIPAGAKILLTYGGGSIKRNGVYDQVVQGLRGHAVIEFGGIEANPRYETLMRAVEIARREKIDFLLSTGGGSVLDGTKFIAAAVPFAGADPWEILSRRAPVAAALPLGCVLTLPATGSEMNSNAVVSRESTREKRAFSSPLLYPLFSILDPETTMSLPPRQTANGVVDAFVHVCEQYMTWPVAAPLQDRQAEAILMTLVEVGPHLLAHPADYDNRATLMWAATQALNGLIGCGVPQDWATHTIGHEITAAYGLDHAQTLAVVLPALLRHQHQQKQTKLLQFGERIWGINGGSATERAEQAIARTEEFFRSLGVKTRLAEYGIDDAAGLAAIGPRIEARDGRIGEHRDLGAQEITAILKACAA